MRCEQIQFELPLYIDDVLTEGVKSAIEEHLPTCPLCRQKLSDYGEIRSSLRQIGNPAIPGELAISLETEISRISRSGELFALGVDRRGLGEKVSHWLLPFGAGALVSVAFAFLFLSFLFVTPATGIFGLVDNGNREIAANTQDYRSSMRSPEDLIVEIPDRSPEVNPTGALIALTRSIVRGKMSDEEVVIVADVFGNGLANIAEIVDPPKDDRAMRELEKAFGTNPDQAPFLPAKMGRGSDAVRVVLKIQRVDVSR
jgi:hypothetical protein